MDDPLHDPLHDPLNASLNVPLEILTEQVEEFARAARAAIEMRLQQVPEGERRAFWVLVAKLYARGLGEGESPGSATRAAPPG